MRKKNIKKQIWIDAREDELAEIDSISKIKARSIKNEIKRLMITIELEKN